MSVLENLTKKVAETAKAAAKKSGDIVEVTKLSVSISTEEDKVEKEYANIGKIVYQSLENDTDVEEAVKECCERIKNYLKNIEGIKQKIQELKNVKTCANCKAELDMEVAYCPKCGTKQEIPQAPVEVPNEKTCTACGATAELDVAFCSKCGNKFEQ